MREKFSKPFIASVDDIKLDIQNFRYYGELSNQRDCINAMLKDTKSGIFNIAADIAAVGLTPDPIVLSKNEKGQWVVREGNRRIAAIKLLKNPSITENKTFQKRIRAIRKRYRGQIPNAIECISCDDESCLLDYLERIHTGFRNGTGRRPWSPENQSYFNMHIGKPAENALAMRVKEMVEDEGTKLKDSYSITNLQRVLQNKTIQSKIGYSWDGEKIEATTDKGTLMAIFKEVAVRIAGKKVREIYTKEKQIKFIDDIVKSLKIDLKATRTEQYSLGGKPNKGKGLTPSRGRIKSKQSWDRKRLIPPRNTRLNIPDRPENVKANNIANELARKIDVREAPNAAAVLLRVLLELSVDRYIMEHQLKRKKTLANGIRRVAEHMARQDKISDNYKGEVIKASDNQNLYSAKTLQSYIHSFDFNPDRQTLCVLWDNLDLFVAKCWK